MIRPKVTVELSGIFFKGNPIAKLHRNTYAVLRDEAEVAQRVAQETLRGKQRTTSPGPSLLPNIVIVPRRMRRGRAEVLVSGNYGPERLVRYYNRFLDTGVRSGSRVRRGLRFYSAGARAAQAHIDSNISNIERRLVEGIT